MKTDVPILIESSALAVRTSGLAKTYQGRRAMENVNLTVPEGAVYLLVGENGAGKTTTLKTLLDLVKADSGSASVLGLDCRRDGPKVRANIGYVPESRGTAYGWLTNKRLLDHHATYFPAWDREYAAELVRRLDVPLDRKFGTLSKGESRRVQLITALAHRPPVLLLDEPTDGLDPLAMDRLLSVIHDHMAATRSTLIISTHLVQIMESLADHLGVMARGRLTCQVPRRDIERKLQRYAITIPEGWTGVTALPGEIIRKHEAGREIEWTVWGDETGIVERLQWSGATVTGVAPLRLQEAAVALLAHEEATR